MRPCRRSLGRQHRVCLQVYLCRKHTTRLLAISENYPDLKSNQNFLALQSQLEGTENRISVARRDYIEAVQAYNTELKTFPGVIWASTLYKGNKPMETFTIAEETKRPPQVKF